MFRHGPYPIGPLVWWTPLASCLRKFCLPGSYTK
jgi:hypothetical protein